MEKLFNGTHPFTMLIKIIEKGESLSDEDCATLFKKVSEEYGETLAVSAIRGKLFFHNKPEKDEVLGCVNISEPDSMKSDGYVNPTISDIELKSNGYSKCQHSIVKDRSDLEISESEKFDVSAENKLEPEKTEIFYRRQAGTGNIRT